IAFVVWAAGGAHGSSGSRTVAAAAMSGAPPASTAAASAPPAEAPPPPPPVQLTHLGGCAYSPTFVDADTVVFDLTRDGADDLYRLDLGAATPVQLTSDPGWEWRAAPGVPPDEVVFLRQGGARDGTEALDLRTGARRPLTDIGGPIVFAGGAYYHAPARGTVLRRLHDGGDEIVLQLPDGRSADTMVASPDGTRLAILFRRRGSAGLLCTVPLEHPALACLPPSPEGGRPAWSADGAALYFDAGVAIDRVELAGGPARRALADVHPAGGLAVAPGGGALVFSDCDSGGGVYDLVAAPERSLAPGNLGHPVAGLGGTVAFVRTAGTRQAVIVRKADGSLDELVVRDGDHLTDLALAADGGQLAFVATGGAQPGIYLVKTASRAEVNRVTLGHAEEHPVFAGGRLLFTRRAADGAPQLMEVALDGTGERLAGPRPRVVLGVDQRRDRVLLGAPGRDHLYWWDPRARRETPGPVLPIDDVSTAIALSPGGAWLLLLGGNNGQLVYRFPLGPRAVKPDLVHPLATDVSALVGAIDDRGHPIVAVDRWAGELWLARPVEGTRW
ncbi:MAG TPA: hypothetical protein VHE35_33425, partial [Kofleriaceae bacterium]|nr:hypothetical protein [Kofleriaceae bacterium]